MSLIFDFLFISLTACVSYLYFYLHNNNLSIDMHTHAQTTHTHTHTIHYTNTLSHKAPRLSGVSRAINTLLASSKEQKHNNYNTC